MSAVRALRAIAVASALATAAVVPGSAQSLVASKQSACKRPKSTTIAQNGEARVFSVRNESYEGETFLVGCRRKTGRQRTLASAVKAEVFDSFRRFDLVRLRGRFVAFRLENVDDCRYGCPEGTGSTQALRSIDLRSGRCSRTAVSDRPAGNRLLVDAGGALAWPRWLEHNQVEVRVLDGTGERALDSGAIHPESLSLTRGGRLSWVIEGNSRSAQLTHSPARQRCY